MSTVTANRTAAFITYSPGWETGEDASGRVTSAPNASALLRFSGTSFALYGQLAPLGGQSNYSLSVVIDGDQFLVDNTQPVAPDDPLYTATALNPNNQVHTANITLVSGTFNLSHIVWTPSATYDKSEIFVNSSSSPPTFTTLPVNQWEWQQQLNTMCIWQRNANITFNFQGNGIAIQGRGWTGAGTRFRASLDNVTTDRVLTARAGENDLIDLYRNDTLDYRDHTVTLQTIGSDTRFCVGKAEIFTIRQASPTTTSSEPEESGGAGGAGSAGGSSSSKAITKGQVAGIVISVVLIPLLIILGVIFYRRRRRLHKPFVAARTVSYDRLCSKCGKPITDDYRLECVDPDCPAGVDLHLKCADWNTPERHSHAVHQVLNK